MAASCPARVGARAALAAVAALLSAQPAAAQLLPWEVTVAEIEAGRLRHLTERLNKQNVLYQLRLGGVRKSDMVETAERIDRLLESLERGDAPRSIPAPWTGPLREQVARVDAGWGPLRSVAVASPHEYYRITRQFMPADSRRGDPLLLHFFDQNSRDLIERGDALIDLYHAECRKTGLAICEIARTSGYSAMLIERAVKQATYVVVGIDAEANRKALAETVAAYDERSHANDQSPFFAEALDPARGVSAVAAAELLQSLRTDWDAMRTEFAILSAGDEENFDLDRLLTIESRLIHKVERLTAALVRYASLTYGS